MISTLYQTVGAATGVAQGLFRGAFKPLPVPKAESLSDWDEVVEKPSATEFRSLIADCSDWSSVPEASSVRLLPLLVAGHARVGKTSLVHTYLHGQHLESPEPTFGADLSIKQLVVKNQHLSLQIWDTAGGDQADLLDNLFWTNAAGAVIVCNLHMTDCISGLAFWQKKLWQDANGLPIVVVGVRHGQNKVTQPQIAEQQAGLAAQWCRDHETCLFIVNHPCDQASAAKAFAALIDKALEFSEHKAKPVYTPSSAAAYPLLFPMHSGCHS